MENKEIEEEKKEEKEEGPELYPNQRTKVMEDTDEFKLAEKSDLKSISDNYEFNLTYVYKYQNKIFYSKPENKTSKPPSVYSMCISNNKSYCIGYSNGEVHLINKTVRISLHNSYDSVLSCKMHPDKSTTLISLTSIGQIFYIHSATGKILQDMHVGDEEEQRARCLELSPSGDKIAIGYKNGAIEIYNEKIHVKETFFDKSFIDSIGHVNQVHSLSFDKSDPNLLVSGGRDRRIVLWDLRKKNAVSMASGPYCLGETVDVKQNCIIGGDYDLPGKIFFFDIRNLKEPFKKIEARTHCYACKFSKKDNSLLFCVGGYGSNNLQFYNNYNKVGINQYTNSIYALDFSSDGLYFGYGCDDGGIRIGNIEYK